jgi:internalin A
MIFPILLAAQLTLVSSIAPPRISPPSSELRLPSPAPLNQTFENTIIFESRDTTDAQMAILDSRPEITTVRFEASAVNYARSDGNMSHGTADFQITDAGFAHLAKAKNLETLLLDPKVRLKITDDGLKSLAGLKIKVLNLGATPFSAKGLAVLSTLNSLSDFSADACPVADVCTAAAKCPSLRVLTLTPYAYHDLSRGSASRNGNNTNYPTDEDIQLLAPLADLEELYIDDSPLTDAIVPTLQKFTKLRVLHVQEAQITDAGIAQLAKLAKLEELNLNATAVTDRAMTTVNGFTALKTLLIDKTKVTDEGLGKLTDLHDLVALSAQQCRLSGTGLAALSQCTQLEFLGLQQTPITDEGIKSLPVLPDLTRIMLQSTNITDACLPHLAKFPKLSFINAMQTNLTDDGMPTLAAMKQLKLLWIRGTKVTDQGKALFPYGQAR